MTVTQFIWLYVILSNGYCFIDYLYKITNKELWNKSHEKSEKVWEDLKSFAYVHLGIKKDEWITLSKEDLEREEFIVKFYGTICVLLFGWFFFPIKVIVKLFKKEDDVDGKSSK